MPKYKRRHSRYWIYSTPGRKLLKASPDALYVDSALDAAGDLHCEGDAGETNDIIEAFLKALVKET
jgi:hypothetical protein